MKVVQKTPLLLLIVSVLLSVNSYALSLNGVAVHKEYSKEQFIGALYTNSPTKDSKSLLEKDASGRMELRILQSRITARRFMNMWVEGVTINASESEQRRERKNLLTFSQLFKGSLRTGDLVVFDYQPSRGMVVSMNQVELATIPSAGFFRMLMSVWIGDIPLSSGFKQGILANGKINKGLQARLASTQVKPGREALVKSWIAPAAEAATAVHVAQAASAVTAASVPKPKAKTKARPKPATKKTAAKPKTPAKARKAAAPKPAQAPVPTQQQPEEAEELYAVLDEAALEAQQQYFARVREQVADKVTLPRQAFQRRIDGIVRLNIEVNRKGEVIGTKVLEEPHAMFGRQAREALEDSKPLPPLPVAIKGSSYQLTIPLVYRLPR